MTETCRPLKKRSKRTNTEIKQKKIDNQYQAYKLVAPIIIPRVLNFYTQTI